MPPFRTLSPPEPVRCGSRVELGSMVRSIITWAASSETHPEEERHHPSMYIYLSEPSVEDFPLSVIKSCSGPEPLNKR